MSRQSRALTLMVQGTTSDAGKSTLVAGLVRILWRQGIKVAPFKPQNMALNSAVTADGGEIGRAQALQALAAGLAPHTDFNPVLLKPSSDIGALVVIHGKVMSHLSARDYHAYKPVAKEAVMQSWQRLVSSYECVLVEGAGSPAEINLRERDIANMGFAEAADVPVILVADIDRGGVFAHLVGTLALLSPTEQARVKGFVINRFRGDITLLQPGLDWLEAHTGKPVLGVVPYLHGLFLDAEDGLSSQEEKKPAVQGRRLRVVAPVLPRIVNHTDLDALRLHPQVDFSWIGPGQSWPEADLVVLPGSANVLADMEWLRAQGMATEILRHLRYGGYLIGIGSGFYMLGETLQQNADVVAGLSVLEIKTVSDVAMPFGEAQGYLCLPGKAQVKGYQMWGGQAAGPALQRPALMLEAAGKEIPDGALSEEGRIIGTTLHGVFDTPAALSAILAWAGLETKMSINLAARREAELDRLADVLETHLDISTLQKMMGFSVE